MIFGNQIVQEVQSLRTLQWRQLINELCVVSNSEYSLPPSNRIRPHNRMDSSEALVDVTRRATWYLIHVGMLWVGHVANWGEGCR